MQNNKANTRESYDKLKSSIRNLYPDGFSEQEADEATRNLLGFAELMLEISIEMELKKQADEETSEIPVKYDAYYL